MFVVVQRSTLAPINCIVHFIISNTGSKFCYNFKHNKNNLSLQITSCLVPIKLFNNYGG